MKMEVYLRLQSKTILAEERTLNMAFITISLMMLKMQLLIDTTIKIKTKMVRILMSIYLNLKVLTLLLARILQ
jgi:hypothetical protein